MNLLIIGLPGSGKGTQAEMIVREYGVKHIATGDMFREAMKQGTEMGKIVKTFYDEGKLVPDEITNAIVKERLWEARTKGFLLDGFPRNMEQAQVLDAILSDLTLNLDAVIHIQVDSSILQSRSSGRFICRNCGATYHKVNRRPKIEGVCDICESQDFYQREDDKPEMVEKRAKLHAELLAPIIEYYQSKGLVKAVDGMGGIDETTMAIKEVLDRL